VLLISTTDKCSLSAYNGGVSQIRNLQLCTTPPNSQVRYCM